MLKSIQCLFLISISIAVLAKPVLAEEQKTSKVSTEHQTLKLYKGYFPYQACLLVTINQVVKKPDRVLLLKATVEDVYLGSYKKGSQFAVSLYYDDEGPNSFSFLSAQKNARQIIAFNHWPKDAESFDELVKVSKNPIGDLWLPCAGRGFHSQYIALLKSIIRDAPTQPAQKRAAFQKFLETKWTTDRINDFCRPETRRTYGEATWHSANYGNDWQSSPMHADKKAELGGKTVDWQASADNNTPTFYNIIVFSKLESVAWDLEHTNPSLEVWTDENFLIHRVGCSINQAAWAHWILNHELHPSSTEYHHLILDRSKETVVKDKTGKVTSYQCRLSDGTTLTAILTKDKSQSIDRILINGKLDSGWTDMYKNNLSNLAKCDKH